MHSTEELFIWAGLAPSLAIVAGLYLGHRVGYRNGHMRGAYDEWEYSYNRQLEKDAADQARLAAERAKRDVRGRYKKVTPSPYANVPEHLRLVTTTTSTALFDQIYK